jgi:SsrA-binding protein
VSKSETVRSIAQNRKARHLYLFLEELECGIALEGSEVKSLRAGHCSIGEAYGRIKSGELWLVGATIPEYVNAPAAFVHRPTRDRKLLVHAREIRQWEKKVREKGTTIVPLEVYFKGHLVKVKVALARGKKLHDKRERERERTDRRDMDRAMSRRR